MEGAEYDELGATHAELGGVLGEQWSFPDTLVNAIRMHHVPGQGRDDTMRKCLFVANLLSAKLYEPTNARSAMEESELPPWVFRTFGNDFDTIIAEMEGLDTDLAQATSLLQLG